MNRLRTRAPATGTLARVWHPGECPGDCGTAEAVLDGGPQTGKDLPVSFPTRHAGYLPLDGGETTAWLMTGLQVILERWGGVPPRLLVDKASAVGRKVAGEVRRTDRFPRVPAHDGCPVTLCHPTSGDEKGPGDNQGGSLRRQWRGPRPDGSDRPAFHQALWGRCEADGDRPHDKQHSAIAPGVREDQAALRPLPRARCDPVRSVPV